VHTHLRMEGTYRIQRATAPVPRGHRVRLVLANSAWQAAGYSLGVVELLRTSQEDQAVGHLGPDLLGADWDPEEAVRRLREAPERAIGEALLDQTRLAGIGNLYKAETLFLRGVHPWRAVGDVADLAGLVELARRLIDANKERVDQSTTGSRRPNETTWVYGRAARPCRRCGTMISRADQGTTQERVTFWCPACQPES
jgi:endonuclease-8